jgi:hypothetical protein
MVWRRSAGESAATTSIWRVLFTLALAGLLALLVDARGVVHAGAGMPDGPARSIALSVGNEALAVDAPLHLTWPWDRLYAALGKRLQPTIPPLLAVASVAESNEMPPVRRGDLSPSTLPVSTLLSAIHRRAETRRLIDTAHPLRLLVTGDSLTEFLGPELVNEATAAGPVRGFVETHYGTGLARPDYVDWSVLARQQVANYRPDAVVIMMGGNDFQNMTLPSGRILLAATPAWTAEYARRAAVCMRVWAQGGRARVYWLSIPPARAAAWAQADLQMNLALRRAAREVRGARYLNILGPVTDHGRYADFVAVGGQPQLVRTPDGVHLTVTGSTLVAHEVLRVLVRDWRLR